MGLFGTNKKGEGDTEEEQQEDDIETYQKSFDCDNCGEEQVFDILMGTTIHNFIEGKKCDCCGCLIDDGSNITKEKEVEEDE